MAIKNKKIKSPLARMIGQDKVDKLRKGSVFIDAVGGGEKRNKKVIAFEKKLQKKLEALGKLLSRNK